jgi:hypothetical protein
MNDNLEVLTLINYTSNLKNILTSISKETFSRKFAQEICCSKLPLFGEEGDCRYNNNIGEFFTPLLSIKNPVLYWFEIVSKNESRDIYNTLVQLKVSFNRNLPAYKKTFSSWHSNILYVGKVKRNFCGRMIVHFGYSQNGHTQGLQLCHWAQKVNLTLKLHYIIFPNELVDLMGLYENTLSKELHPLFGKHK